MAGLRVRAFEIPEVLLDWTLLRHALENAIANAHKYGCAGGETELAVEYSEPRLTLTLTLTLAAHRTHGYTYYGHSTY